MHLETMKWKLANENKKLATENYQLHSELRSLQIANQELNKENENLRQNMNFACIHCGQSQIAGGPHSDGYDDQNCDDYNASHQS